MHVVYASYGEYDETEPINGVQSEAYTGRSAYERKSESLQSIFAVLGDSGVGVPLDSGEQKQLFKEVSPKEGSDFYQA